MFFIVVYAHSSSLLVTCSIPTELCNHQHYLDAEHVHPQENLDPFSVTLSHTPSLSWKATNLFSTDFPSLSILYQWNYCVYIYYHNDLSIIPVVTYEYFIFLQISNKYSFLYIQHFLILYQFKDIWLFPSFGYDEECCQEHLYTNFSF